MTVNYIRTHLDGHLEISQDGKRWEPFRGTVINYADMEHHAFVEIMRRKAARSVYPESLIPDSKPS